MDSNNFIFKTNSDIEIATNKISYELFGLEYQAKSCLNKINIYLGFPKLIKQPLILNFWGPTGTGKTQLVNKLVELSGLQALFVRINLAAFNKYTWDQTYIEIRNVVNDTINHEHKAVVLFFDEMQHAKCLNEERNEIKRDDLAEIWEIMDRGLFNDNGEAVKTIIFTAGNINLFDTENVMYWDGLPNEEDQQLSMPLQFIHEALSKRFRPEMMARLRNNHYIFPPINSIRAKKIISRDLEYTQTVLHSYFNDLKLKYDNALIEFLFNKIPSRGMGARGIESVLNQIIHSNMTHWLLSVTDKGHTLEEVDSLELTGSLNELKATITLKNNQILHHVTNLKIDSLKNKNNNPDEIAIHAVHEAGHALAGFLMGGFLPEIISVGSGFGGKQAYVKFQSGSRILSKKRVLAYSAKTIGGYIAEEILFGKEKITGGSSSDFEQLFKIISQSLFESGFGNSLLTRKISSEFFESPYPEPKEKDIYEIDSYINYAASQTRMLLTSQKNALQKVAEQVFFRGELTTKEFLDIVEETIDKKSFSNFHDIDHKNDNGMELSLKELIAKIDDSYVNHLFKNSFDGKDFSEWMLIGSKKAEELNLLFPNKQKNNTSFIEEDHAFLVSNTLIN